MALRAMPESIMKGGHYMSEWSCWRCRKTITVETLPRKRTYCPECEKYVEHRLGELRTKYTEIRKKLMCERALRILEDAGVNMYSYIDIGNIVYNAYSLDMIELLSADEMVAAMVLEHSGIYYEANKKVGPYTVDFYIPEKKIVLEIDGDRHKMRPLEDNRRDLNLRAILGAEWEIVRIETRLLEMNPEKLPEAMEAVYNEKKKIRSRNNGIIPEYFSKRERTHYASLTPKQKARSDDW